MCKRALSTVVNRHLKNEIGELQVFCSCRDRGCDWKGKLETYDKHTDQCGYGDVPCGYCGDRVQRRHYASHLQNLCKRCPISCPNCGGRLVERGRLPVHLQWECPLVSTECPFAEVGCRAVVHRRDLGGHLASHSGAHLVQVREKSEVLQAEWRERKKSLVASEERQFKQREDEIAMLNRTLQEMEQKVEILSRLIAEAEREIQDLGLEQRHNRERVEKEMRKRDAEIQRLKGTVTQLQEQMKIKFFGPPLPRSLEITWRPEPPTTNEYVPPVIFYVRNFEERRWNNEIWTSPPFFSHRGGYKMCLVVYPNGCGSGLRKWVSIYVSLVKGENDDSLRWPFTGQVTVEVRNQVKNMFHVQHTITLDGRTDATCDTRKRIRDGYLADMNMGTEKFVVQDLLSPQRLFPERKYLKNDCLEVWVTRVKLG